MLLVIAIILYIIFCGLPLVLVINNFVTLVRKKKIKKFGNADIYSIFLSVIYVVLLWMFLDYKEYTVALAMGEDGVMVHSPLGGKHILSIVVIYLLAYISYIFLRKKKGEIAPLLYVLCWSLVLLANILSLVVLVQLWEHLFGEYEYYTDPLGISSELLLLLPGINFFICSISLFLEYKRKYIQEGLSKTFENKFLDKINKIIIKSSNWNLVIILFTFPVLIILILILILFGQDADSLIKVFTETSDWTLSQQISPPPVSGGGHYLCTVALRGHENIVKPKRFGLRGGKKIVVNRQLMVANAFEDMIMEKFPKFHKFIRDIYDSYGYPLSKLITNSYKADLTYILMKPLEYLFLICLYLVDKKPENRIRKQYLPVDFMKKIRS